MQCQWATFNGNNGNTYAPCHVTGWSGVVKNTKHTFEISDTHLPINERQMGVADFKCAFLSNVCRISF